MFKNVKILSWISLLLLILSITFSSYAWYVAKVNSDNTISIGSNEVTLTLAVDSVNKLKPQTETTQAQSATYTFNLNATLAETKVYTITTTAHYLDFNGDKQTINVSDYFTCVYTLDNIEVTDVSNVSLTTGNHTLTLDLSYSKTALELPIELLNTEALVFEVKLSLN